MTQIDIYFYAALILLFLAWDSRKRLPRAKPKTRIFRIEIYVTAFLLLVEALSWISNRRPGYETPNYITHAILYAFSLMPLSLWLVYLDFAILTHPKERLRRKIVYATVNAAVLTLVVINPFTGVLFRIAGGNAYVRGPAVYAIMAMNLLLFAGYAISLIPHRRLISGRVTQVILLLGILPCTGGVLQTMFYGATLTWPMMALVAIGAYVLIEREEMQRDLVTGLLTRPQLEDRMRYKITRRQPYYVIMIDLDHFKSINDRFGHEEGDDALATVGNILTKSVKQGDAAYRYAGDEFMLLVETNDERAMPLIRARLLENLDRFNAASEKPYAIAFSMGFARYDGKADANVKTLCSLADEAMYMEKRGKRVEMAAE
jgi:diguanylate cyclase (GGDEF)-like protein